MTPLKVCPFLFKKKNMCPIYILSIKKRKRKSISTVYHFFFWNGVVYGFFFRQLTLRFRSIIFSFLIRLELDEPTKM